jgi:hypothetical protein
MAALPRNERGASREQAQQTETKTRRLTCDLKESQPRDRETSSETDCGLD